MQLWSSKVQDPVAVHDDLTHLTLDVIGQSAFGYNFNTVLGGESKVSEAVNIATGGMSLRYAISKSLIPFFELLPIGETRRIKHAREIADNTVLEVRHFIVCLKKLLHCDWLRTGQSTVKFLVCSAMQINMQEFAVFSVI